MKSITKRDGRKSLNIYIMHMLFWYRTFRAEPFKVLTNQNPISM